MKPGIQSIVTTQILVIISVLTVMAQERATVTGTIGKERAHGDTIVVCVLGTQACMPMRVDITRQITVGGLRECTKRTAYGAARGGEGQQNYNGITYD